MEAGRRHYEAVRGNVLERVARVRADERELEPVLTACGDTVREVRRCRRLNALQSSRVLVPIPGIHRLVGLGQPLRPVLCLERLPGCLELDFGSVEILCRALRREAGNVHLNVP